MASAVSKHLAESAILIARLAAADVASQDDTANITKLPAQAASLQESITSQTTSIALTRARVTGIGDQIHTAYRDLFETSIRIIEQTIHGSVARGTKSKAEHLSVVAKGMELKLQYVKSPSLILKLHNSCEVH